MLTPIKGYLLAQLRTRYASAQSQAEKLVIVGEVVSLLGDDLSAELKANSDGFPCVLLRAVSRCMPHC